MKTFALYTVGLCVAIPGIAFGSLVGMNVEQVAVDGNGLLPGTTTWRLYAEFDSPNDQLTSVGGAYPNAGAVISYSGFYQHTFGGPLSSNINSNLIGVMPDLYYDSWVTIGAEWMFESGTLNSSGIDFTSFEAGNNLWIANGEWTRPMNDPYAFGQVVGSMPNYQVLVGQFTTNGYGPNSAPWGQLNLSGFSSPFGLTGEPVPWSLENVSFGTPVPAPGALALLGLAVLGAPRRRR